MPSKRMKRSKKSKRSRIQRYKTKRSSKLGSRRTKLKKRTRRKKVKKSKRLKGGTVPRPGGPDLGFLFQPGTGVDPEVLINIAEKLSVKDIKSLMGANRLLLGDSRVKQVFLDRAREPAIEFIGTKEGIYNEETKSVTLKDKDIKDQDLHPISYLTDLRKLVLSGNNIQNLAPLASLTALTYLDLSKNQIQDVEGKDPVLAPLASLTALTYLDLGTNQIKNVAPLASLTNLQQLNLTNNRIENRSTLKNLSARVLTGPSA